MSILTQYEIVRYAVGIVLHDETSLIPLNHGHLHLISKIAAETGVIARAIFNRVSMVFIHLINTIGELADTICIWLCFPLVALAIIGERVIEG